MGVYVRSRNVLRHNADAQILFDHAQQRFVAGYLNAHAEGFFCSGGRLQQFVVNGAAGVKANVVVLQGIYKVHALGLAKRMLVGSNQSQSIGLVGVNGQVFRVAKYFGKNADVCLVLCYGFNNFRANAFFQLNLDKRMLIQKCLHLRGQKLDDG